ncbi:MAG: hypothetical protein IJ411_04995, partial [Oscillospiraceae bacterium]|nr:hypothetical protein [Oscillospiraceae bacterium]
NASLDVFPFQRDFTNVTVSFYEDGKEENKLSAFDREESFRMMAGIPTGYFVRAEKKEELTLDQGTFVLIENFDGQKLAFYEGKTQVKYWSADGKVAYYELGADYYDIARMVAEKVAGWDELEDAITLTPTADLWLVGTEEIQLVLENKTERQLYGSESFQLELWKNGKWVEVKHPDSNRKVNPDIGVVYAPQSKNTILVDLTERFGELTAGYYRLTMTSVTPNPSAEFELLEGTANVLTIVEGGFATSIPLHTERQKSFIREVFSELKSSNRKSSVDEPYVSVSVLESGKPTIYYVSKSNYDSNTDTQYVMISGEQYLFEVKGNLFEKLADFYNSQLNPEFRIL